MKYYCDYYKRIAPDCTMKKKKRSTGRFSLGMTETDIVKKKKMNVFYLKKKNSCGTSIARASLGPRRGRRRARLIGELCRRRPTPTAAGHRTTPSRLRRRRRRPPPHPQKSGRRLRWWSTGPSLRGAARARSIRALPRSVTATVVGGLREHTHRRRHHPHADARAAVYTQSTGGSSTSRRCSLCCSAVWWWWCFVFGSRAPTQTTITHLHCRRTATDEGPDRREMGRVLL